MNNIPIDLFLDKYKPSDGELEFDKIKTTQEKLFSIPISFKVEKKEIHNIDNLFKYVENKPDSAKSSKYPLFERYELYRSKIMVFSKYADFMDHIVKSLESSKNNEELFNDLLDTLGCEVFDFIKEMVENRYSDIDFSSPFDDGM